MLNRFVQNIKNQLISSTKIELIDDNHIACNFNDKLRCEFKHKDNELLFNITYQDPRFLYDCDSNKYNFMYQFNSNLCGICSSHVFTLGFKNFNENVKYDLDKSELYLANNRTELNTFKTLFKKFSNRDLSILSNIILSLQEWSVLCSEFQINDHVTLESFNLFLEYYNKFYNATISIEKHYNNCFELYCNTLSKSFINLLNKWFSNFDYNIIACYNQDLINENYIEIEFDKLN